MDMDQAQEAASFVATTTAKEVSEKATTWFESIKKILKLDSIDWTPQTLMYMGLYGVGGFLCGFFFKRFSSYVFVLILIGLGIYVLDQMGIISMTISTTRLQEILGISSQTMNMGIASMLWEWIINHVLFTVCSVVGFFLGFKLA